MAREVDLAWLVQESTFYSFEKKLTIKSEIFVTDKMPMRVKKESEPHAGTNRK